MKELPGNVLEIDREPVQTEIKDEEPKRDITLDLEKKL